MTTNPKIEAAILYGNSSSIGGDVQHELDQGRSAQSILDTDLLPAMAIVGDRFKRNEMFLPQVLMSAQAMQAAIDLLKPHLMGAAAGMERKRVLVGTVKGDMHDIGKNLVRIMLMGAGFDVIDLGVNTPAKRFLDQARETRTTVICLSALLSSTMQHMRDVVETFRADPELKGTHILVGGAPVSSQFAHDIGADGYAATAPGAVELVQDYFQKGHTQ